MNLFTRPILPFFVTMTLLLFGCSTPKELEYRDFKNLTINKIGFSATAIRMDLIYYNPNRFGLELKSFDLDIFINGNYLGHSVQEQFVSIPGREEFAIPVKVDVDMKNLLKNGFNSFLNNEVNMKVTGTVKIGKGNIFKSFPVNYEGIENFSIF